VGACSTPPKNKTVLDQIAAAGLKVMYSIKDTYFGGPNGYPTVITSRDAEGAFIKKTIAEHKDPEAVLGCKEHKQSAFACDSWV
jgi:hypothetical protein